jgi:serine/threonine protein kinase
MRTGLGFIKIGEFGDAQMTDPNIEERQIDFCSLSNISPYMAPECILQLNIDTPSDIWSFGCIMGSLMTGEEPWSMSTESSPVFYRLAASNRLPFNIESLSCSVEGKIMLQSIFVSDPVKRPSATQLLNLSYFMNLPYSVI